MACMTWARNRARTGHESFSALRRVKDRHPAERWPEGLRAHCLGTKKPASRRAFIS